MKHIPILTAAVLGGILHVSCGNTQELPAILKEHANKAAFTKVADGTAQLTPLFNGKDLTGWYTYTQTYGKNNDAEKAFTVENGALRFAGEAMGYLCTSDTYKDYYLRVVFRWGEKKYAPREDRPRDSGILYHLAESEEDKVWPTSVECQIQENDCGDYYLVGDVTLESPNAPNVGSEERLQRVVRTENFEKPNAEWNTIEVICLDNTSEHYVNGHKVNEAYNLSVAEGKILLQLEGAEVFYKTIELLPLK